MSSAAVAKQVLFELKATGGPQVAAEIQRVEAQLKATKATTTAVGDATSNYSQKVGIASRQLASAAETMARTGKISGEATKQIIAQGTNIAFAFGAGGAVVGALGIFGLAVAQIFGRAREEAKQLREALDDTFASLQKARNYAQTGRSLVELYSGDPTAQNAAFRRGFGGLSNDVSAATARLNAAAARGNERDIERARDALNALLAQKNLVFKEIERTQALFNEQAKEEQKRLANAKQLAADENATDEARAEAKRQVAEAERAELRAREEYQRALEQFDQDFSRLVLRELGTSTQQVAAEFDALIARGKELKATPEQLQTLAELRDQAVAAQTALATVGSLLQEIGIQSARGVEPTVDTFQRLSGALDLLQRELKGLTPDTEAYRKVLAEIEKIERRRADLLKGVTSAGGSGAPTGENVRTAADLAREVQQAADGALQLAQNLGGADSAAIGLLRSITQIAGNLPALQEALKSGNGLGILSAGLPILGALSSLIGESPEDAERRRVLEENTEAIKDLTEKAGLLGIGVSGTDSAAAREALRTVISAAERLPPGSVDVRRLASRGYGIDVGDLDEIAGRLGITLDGSIESFRQLERALADTITKLGEFGTDLESQQRQAEAEIDIFGIRDPLEQLGIRNRALAGRSPALDGVLAGLDLNSAEGRAAARQRAQELFRVLQAGGETLGAGALGGLTGDELLDAILELVRSLDEVDESLGLNTSTVGQADRIITADRTQITADQASRLLGVATAQLAELRIIREALTAARNPLAVPSLTAGFSSGASALGGPTITITQSFEFHGAADAKLVARATTDAMVEALDQALGTKLLIQRRYAGKGVTS